MEENRIWKILLVDDDEDDYLITRELLADAKGARVQLTWKSTFEDAQEVLRHLEDFDAALVDYDLGLHNGLELIRAGVQQGSQIPFILLTGRGNYEVDVEAMQAGASLYLTKSEINALLLERSIRYAMERKRIEEALRVSEERYKNLISLLPAAVYAIDQEGRIIYYNRRAVELWGRVPDPDDDAQRYCASYRLWLPDGSLLPHNQTPMVDALTKGTTVSGKEVIIEQESGKRVTVSVNINPLYDASGAIIGAINVFVDITDRKKLEVMQLAHTREMERKNQQIETELEDRKRVERALEKHLEQHKQTERELRESEERFRLLAELIPQLVWSAEPDGRVDYYNPRHKEYRGIAPQRENQWTWSPSVHSEDQQRTENLWAHCVRTGEDYQIEHRVLMADGSYRWHLSRAQPMRNAEGQIIKWFGTATDIHDQRQPQQIGY